MKPRVGFRKGFRYPFAPRVDSALHFFAASPGCIVGQLAELAPPDCGPPR